MRFPVLIDGPPTSVLGSLGPVDLHGFELPRSRTADEQIQYLPAPASPLISQEHIPHPGLKALQHVLQLPQRDALRGVFQPIQRGSGDTELPGCSSSGSPPALHLAPRLVG